MTDCDVCMSPGGGGVVRAVGTDIALWVIVVNATLVAVVYAVLWLIERRKPR